MFELIIVAGFFAVCGLIGFASNYSTLGTKGFQLWQPTIVRKTEHARFAMGNKDAYRVEYK